MALETGASLVPIYGFGHTSLLSPILAHRHSNQTKNMFFFLGFHRLSYGKGPRCPLNLLEDPFRILERVSISLDVCLCSMTGTRLVKMKLPLKPPVKGQKSLAILGLHTYLVSQAGHDYSELHKPSRKVFGHVGLRSACPTQWVQYASCHWEISSAGFV